MPPELGARRHEAGIGLRDRLLLCFADLSSYGIEARPAVAGTVAEGRTKILAEIRAKHPNAIGSYIFRTQADDANFLVHGNLSAESHLGLYHSGPDVARAAQTVCNRLDITVLGAGDDQPLIVKA